MDFGAILDAWEAQKHRPPVQKEAQEERRGNNEKREKREKNELSAWLEAHEVIDKDSCAEAAVFERESPAARRRRLMGRRPDGVLDLHGQTQDEAWTSLNAFFQESRRRGFEKVLIIHGKGIHSPGAGVLKQLVRSFVERCPWAGESGYSPVSNGGSGATWVFLKRF